MPTILGPRFDSTFSGRPTRMSAEDFDIWSRWWPTVREGTVAVYFDVGLGLPDDLPQTDDAAQLLGWIRNTQKRADVLIERQSELWLVELRFRASLNAVGRLGGYETLLRQDNPFQKPIISFLVTNERDTEVEQIANSLEQRYVIA